MELYDVQNVPSVKEINCFACLGDGILTQSRFWSEDL